MDKKELIAILEEIGTLLELKGENPFKCRAYYNAARSLESEQAEPQQLVESGRLSEVKGIGKGLQEKITELVTTERLAYHEQLRSEFPETLFELLKIPGMGPKKVKAVYDKLEVSTIGELEYACNENRLVALDGFGEKSQAKVLKGIEMLKRFQGRFLYKQAQTEAKALYEALADHRSVVRISICGSLRRSKEVIRDIDLLVSTRQPASIMKVFTSLPGIHEVTAHGETKSSIVLTSGLQADLRAVTEEQFPYALNYFTGSKAHNTALRGLAKKKGLKLNEYGLFRGSRLLKCKDEEELYAHLGLAYVPPELREDTGEIEAAANGGLPRLVEAQDIRGAFHVHTNWSDGAASLEVMAKAAARLGYAYLGIADHSKTAIYADGLSEKRIKEQQAEIDQLNRKLKNITLLKGIESDILPDGRLDYSEQVLGSFDFVIVSVHSHFGMSEAEMTQRICRALEHPRATMLGHPTGRLLLSREEYALNMQKVLQTAVKQGKMIELNAHPYRLDLDWRFCKVAREMQIPICINPDAHALEGLEDMRYGLAAARRGWLSKEDVFNTRSLAEVRKALRLKH